MSLAAEDDKEVLRKRVIAFAKQQPGYDASLEIYVPCDSDQYFILYGSDIQVGVAGFGSNADGAYNDFIDNWSFYNSGKST